MMKLQEELQVNHLAISITHKTVKLFMLTGLTVGTFMISLAVTLTISLVANVIN